MIAVDDLTPRDGKAFTYFTEQEKLKFGPNAGRGHGYIMKRIYDAVNPEFPDLRLMMVVAPYASENHDSQYPEIQDYYRQWGEAAPEQVFLVWTGRNVFSPVITKADQDHVKQYLSGQRMIVFDNSNGVAAPLPVWNGTRFPGMEKESDGVVVIWGSFFLRPLERIYYLTAIDYFWDPENYNADRSYALAAHELFGEAAAQPMLRLQKAFQAMEAAISTTDRSGFAPLLAEFESALAAAKKVTASDGKPLPLSQLDAPLAAAREFMNAALPKAEVSPGKPAAIKLTDGKNPDDPAPTAVTVASGRQKSAAALRDRQSRLVRRNRRAASRRPGLPLRRLRGDVHPALPPQRCLAELRAAVRRLRPHGVRLLGATGSTNTAFPPATTTIRNGRCAPPPPPPAGAPT